MTESGGVVLKSGGRIDVLAHAPADIISSVFVMAAGLIAEWAQPHVRVADPALSALASVLLVAINYQFMREAGMVLLQTVPEGLGACSLRAAALRVPGVLALHELHVWQLYPHHVVATAHVFYRTHEDYQKCSELVTEVFTRHGISLVTLQPEFPDATDGTDEDVDSGAKEALLVARANESCGRPCAAHCTAPRCCLPALPAAAPARCDHDRAPRDPERASCGHRRREREPPAAGEPAPSICLDIDHPTGGEPAPAPSVPPDVPIQVS